jgi:NTE family protein
MPENGRGTTRASSRQGDAGSTEPDIRDDPRALRSRANDERPAVTDAEAVEHAVNAYLPLPEAQRHGIGLCLSGGGFRAALFHLGALRRLHELGILARVWTVSSVSGGSIAAAHLATSAPWPIALSAKDWEDRIGAPLRALTSHNFRTPPLLRRLLPWNWFRSSTAVETLARLFERRLTPLALGQLPAMPMFVLSATDMAFGDNWVFQRDRMGAYQSGYVTPFPKDWPLARAVAASACFPPVFNPMRLEFPKDRYVDGNAFAGKQTDEAFDDLRLTDGGNYDNLALEPVWKKHQTVLVSDGGGLFPFQSDRNLFRRLQRYTAIVENQARALRKRWLVASFQTGVLHGAYWGIGSARSRYDPKDGTGYSKDLAQTSIASIRTDMDSFSEPEAAVLENHGYLMADVAIRTHVQGLVPSPVPPLRIPHDEWMDEVRARRALAKSHKRRLLGRWGRS